MIIGRIIGGINRKIDRYIRGPLAHSKFDDINILDTVESINYIIEHKCSVSRFGDGEFDLIRGGKIGYQKPDVNLAKQLSHVLAATDAPNHIVGIPLPLKDVSLLKKGSKDFWNYFVLRYGKRVRGLLSSGRTYVDTQLSRFYSIYDDISYSDTVWHNLKRIWESQDIVIVEGTQTRSGVGNDLYDNARSIARIIGPAENAYSMYNEMLHAITSNVTKEKLILLCYGPTATILAYDLAKLGYRAIDLGHLDIEYEWYRMKVPHKVAVKGKYTNEVDNGNIVEDNFMPLNYREQIIVDITI